MKNLFITGVDTDIGKTFVSLGLCLTSQKKGLKTGYFKPLQSGAYEKEGNLIAPDLYELNKYSNIEAKYSYLFKGEVSPGLAALLDNIDVDFEKIKKDFDEFSSRFDITISEGAGGLYCPVCKGKLFSDLIKELNQEIIIVTTPKLGRLNHLLMTIDCAEKNGIKIKGIIINKVSNTPALSEKNFIKEYKNFYNYPVLAEIKELKNPSREEIISQFKNIEL